MPPENIQGDYISGSLPSLTFIACAAFWLWMAVHAYRRRGGLDVWHWFFFFFPPSTALYFILHLNDILSVAGRAGEGRGLFGWGLKKRIRRAEQQLRIADTIAVRSELAELYFENGRYAECEQQYKSVIEQDRSNLDAFYYLACCRMKAGDNTGALEYLQRVMKDNSKLRFGLAWLRYTDCLLALGRRDEAVEERRKLSRSFPRPLTEFAYALSLAESGQKDKAREVLEYMLATSQQAPREDRVWWRRGRSLLRTLT